MRHLLDDQTKGCFGRRTLGLAQKAGRGALPRAGHRAQNLGQLAGGIFGEGLVHFAFVGAQGLAQGIGGVGAAVEQVRVEAGDMGGIARHKAQIDRVGTGLAVSLLQRLVPGRVHADVEDGARAAPVRIGGRGADRDQRTGPEMFQDRRRIDRRALRYGPHGRGGQRHGQRHRQVHPDQPLQTFGAPAMRLGPDLGRRRDLGIVARGLHGGLHGILHSILHCGAFRLRLQDIPCGVWCKRGGAEFGGGICVRPPAGAGVSHPRTPVGYLRKNERRQSSRQIDGVLAGLVRG